MAKEKAAVIKNATSTPVIMLYPEQLEVRKGFNVRFDMGDLTEMGKTILQGGIRLPLRGYKSDEKTSDGWPKYIVTDGHRRLAAALRIADKMEDADFIPFRLEPKDYTDTQRTIDMLVTGETGKSHNLLETARGVKRLMSGDEPMKQAEVAKAIGKSPMYVSDCVRLMDEATDTMIKQIETGQIAATTILEMLKANPAEKVEKVVNKAIAKSDAKAGGAGKGKVKASELKEESGEPMTAKGKKIEAAKKAAKEPAEKASKMDATLEKLVNLKAALKAQDGVQNKEAFGILNALIKLGKGVATPLDLVALFFVEEEPEEEEAAPIVKKKKADPAPVKKSASPKKKKTEEDEDEEPTAKAVKKAAIELEDLDEDDEDLEIE